MAFTSAEYTELLGQVRDEMKSAGYAYFDERIEYTLIRTESGFHALTQYLHHAILELSLNSSDHLNSLIRRFNASVKTSEGGLIRGVKVALEPNEQRAYRVESIDFTPDRDFDEALIELRGLLLQIEQDHNAGSDPEVNVELQ